MNEEIKNHRETYKRNGIETILDNDGIVWLNGKYIEERLDHKNLREVAIKYHSDYRKHELVEKPKKICNIIFKDEKLAVKVIII